VQLEYTIALQIPFDISSLRMHPESFAQHCETFRRVTRVWPNIWNARRIQSEVLEYTSIVKECTTNFHSDGIPAHSGYTGTRVTGRVSDPN